MERLLLDEDELGREAAGYIANEAAKGLTKEEWRLVESGNTDPLDRAAERLAARLGASASYLALLRTIAEVRDDLATATRLLVERAHAETGASGLTLATAAKISSDTASRWLREPLLQTGAEWEAARAGAQQADRSGKADSPAANG